MKSLITIYRGQIPKLIYWLRMIRWYCIDHIMTDEEEEILSWTLLYYKLSVCLSHCRQTDRQKLRHAAHIAGLPSASCMEAADLPPTDSYNMITFIPITIIITCHTHHNMCPTHAHLHLSDCRIPWDSCGSASRWRRVPAGPPAVRTAGWTGSESSCWRTSAHWNCPSLVLVVSGRAGGGSQYHQPSLMRGGERRGGGGGVLSLTVSKEIPARSSGAEGTSRQTPFKILIL